MEINNMSGECPKCGNHTLECDCTMEWISVEEKLPNNNDDVLVYNPKDGIAIGDFEFSNVSGYYEKDGSYFITDSGWTTQYDWAPYMCPTHWMPLPVPPKE